MEKIEQAARGGSTPVKQSIEYDHRQAPLNWISVRGSALKESHLVLSIDTELTDSLLEKLRKKAFTRMDPTYLDLPNFQAFSYREYQSASLKCGHFAFHCIIPDQQNLSSILRQLHDQFNKVLPALETTIYSHATADANFHSYGIWSLYAHVAKITGSEFQLDDISINVANYINVEISSDKATLKKFLTV
jgi:hypothetical protein